MFGRSSPGCPNGVHPAFSAAIPAGATVLRMESGPAVFAGAAFTLFGAGLLLWTSVRVRLREPVAEGAGQVTAAVLASVFGAAFLAAGLWAFTRL
ncbi:hypothetical protein SAMN05192584_12055 [Streptomyces pini]|uniref:Uncharacterized protein n=2 Tax=Streptomyces pini TaxID=1520580 RepID=A0A1I4I8Y8_9ACTN|nr:hypothetical protein SAMN05192584_12055 [Streptomyces pini]